MEQQITLYVGTYTRREPHVDGKAAGIYVYTLNAETGQLVYQSTATGVVNPSFLTLSPQGDFLYAVNEVADGEVSGAVSGAVSAFAIDAATGNLTFLNKQPSSGSAPCYVSTDPTGQFVLAANYVTGNVSVLPVLGDGRLALASNTQQHHGHGPDPRQDGPHAHCIMPDGYGRFYLSADLGTDQIMVYTLDRAQGKLIPAAPPVQLIPGSGPRHLCFHPHGRVVYVLAELSSQVFVLAYDPESGDLRHQQTIATLPPECATPNTGAHVQVSPDGKFLYASNRGHDSLAIFAITARTGLLTPVGHEPTQGQTPRHFTMDRHGRFLLVANQDSDTVVVFRRDEVGGGLTAVAPPVPIPTPVCLHLRPKE
ncbi:MAG: beta-propeller fold lactonase family protein [Anaerolineae bacterium]|nr:beta-propeller fold lactonase family protein [Anaerolineae bacterium]